MDRNELISYARSVRDQYSDLEEKHKQQVQANKYLNYNLREVGQRARDDMQHLNNAYNQIYEAQDHQYTDYSKNYYSNTSDGLGPSVSHISDIKRDASNSYVPFTNSSIKTQLMTTNDTRQKLRETLDRELADIPLTSDTRPHTTKHATTQNRSAKKEKRDRSDEPAPRRDRDTSLNHQKTKKDKSQTSTPVNRRYEDKENRQQQVQSFEDFGDELKRLKKIVNSKITHKGDGRGQQQQQHGRKNSKSNLSTSGATNTSHNASKTLSSKTPRNSNMSTRMSSKGGASTKGATTKGTRNRSRSITKK